MSQRSMNILKFVIISFLVQTMIVTINTAAMAGPELLNESTLDYGEATRGIHSAFNSTDTIDNVSRRGTEPTGGGTFIEAIYEVINLGIYVAETLGIMWLFTGAQAWITFSVTVATQSGQWGWLLGSIVGMWQLATIIAFLEFVMPGRMRQVIMK